MPVKHHMTINIRLWLWLPRDACMNGLVGEARRSRRPTRTHTHTPSSSGQTEV